MRLVKDFVAGKTTGAILAAGTSLQVSVADASNMPQPVGGDYFTLALTDGAGNYEIVYVTAVNPGTGILTVTRGQESTIAKDWAVGTLFRLGITAQTFQEVLTARNDLDPLLVNQVELLQVANNIDEVLLVDDYAMIAEDTPISAAPAFTFDPAVAVSTVNDTITWAAHGLGEGQLLFYPTVAGTAIGGLVFDTLYFAKVVDANTIQLSATRGGAAIDLTSVGTGSAHKLQDAFSLLHFAAKSRASADEAQAAEAGAVAIVASMQEFVLGEYANASAAWANPNAVGNKSIYFNTTAGNWRVLGASSPNDNVLAQYSSTYDAFLQAAVAGEIPNSAAIAAIVIASGAITPTKAAHSVSAESGAADDLATITTSNFATGDIIKLAPTSGHTITIKHGSGNITTNTGADIVLSGNEFARVHVAAGGVVVFKENGEPSSTVLYAMQARLGEIDARAYNGGALTAATVQAAIDANPGKTIFLAGGTWVFGSTTVEITVGETSIRGAGAETLVTSSVTAFRFRPADLRGTPTVNGCRLFGLKLGYSGASVTDGAYAIEAIKTNRMRMWDIYWSGYHFGLFIARGIQSSFFNFAGVSPIDAVTVSGSSQIVLGAAETRIVAAFDPSVAVNLTTNTITLAGHGRSDGEYIGYDANGGTAIGGLTSGASYYVVGATTDTFQVSLTAGGEAIDLTSNGTGAAHEFFTYSRTISTEIYNFHLTGGTYGDKTHNCQALIRCSGADGVIFDKAYLGGGLEQIVIAPDKGLGFSGQNVFSNIYCDGLFVARKGLVFVTPVGGGTIGPIQVSGASTFANYDDATETIAIDCAAPCNHLTIDPSVHCANQDVGINFTGGDSSSRLTTFARLENCAVDGIRLATAKSAQIGGIIDGTGPGAVGVEQLSGTVEQLIWIGASLTNWTTNVSLAGTVTYEKGFAVSDDSDTHWDNLTSSGFPSTWTVSGGITPVFSTSQGTGLSWNATGNGVRVRWIKSGPVVLYYVTFQGDFTWSVAPTGDIDVPLPFTPTVNASGGQACWDEASAFSVTVDAATGTDPTLFPTYATSVCLQHDTGAILNFRMIKPGAAFTTVGAAHITSGLELDFKGWGIAEVAA